MKILTIIGARPQFIKAGVVSRAIKETGKLEEIILHTGQHFDANMSNIFFEQLGIPAPDYLLNISGGTHGDMTGRMLIEIEKVLIQERPDRVLVYGDTNSTLAGALAAAKLHIPVAHVEAGLRSFNRKMPEEVNRVLTDHLSDLLLCPTDGAIRNLTQEGIHGSDVNVINVGDVMLDSALFFAQAARPPAFFANGNNAELLPESVGEENSSKSGSRSFILSTLHRAENTDDPERLGNLVQGLNEIHDSIAPVVLPLHPRTREALSRARITLNVRAIDPVGYMEMLWMLQRCGLVITDSGGLQKEAFFFDRFCVTMRDQTEWTELLDIGANILVGADKEKLIRQSALCYGRSPDKKVAPYGDGDAAKRIVQCLLQEARG